MGGVSKMKKQFVPFFLVVMITATLQSTTAAGGGEPSPLAAQSSPAAGAAPAAANPWAAQNPSSPEAQDFIHSLCNATCPTPQDVRECFKLLAPYAVFINGSNIRAVRSGVTVVVAELQALDKNAIEFNTAHGLPGSCMQVIQEAANGGKQQLADLARLDGKVTDQDLANVNKWYQDVKAKIKNCDYNITDVPRSQVVLNALAALDGLVSSAGRPK